jgi:hypothetical protein
LKTTFQKGEKMGRSILAVIAGYLIIAVAVMALFAISFPDADPANIPAPSMGFMLFSIVYGFVFAVLGGYVTALLAKRAEMKHTLALGALGVVLGIISMVTAAGREPLWYQITNMVVIAAAVLLGGYFRTRKVKAQAGLNAAA